MEYVLEGGGRGPCPGCSDGGGGGEAHTTGFLVTASEKGGSGYACTTSMIRVDPGISFMLSLGPGPPSLLHLTRANETLLYAVWHLGGEAKPCKRAAEAGIVAVRE